MGADQIDLTARRLDVSTHCGLYPGGPRPSEKADTFCHRVRIDLQKNVIQHLNSVQLGRGRVEMSLARYARS